MRNNTTSFFFTNFLDSWESSALWKMFDRYGSMMDVYISFKKMKKGTRFGFVRFKNIVDLVAFEGRLRGIFISGSRLIINRAKFFKDGDKSFPTSDFPPLNPVNRNKTRVNTTSHKKSFMEAVLQNAWDIISNNGLVNCNAKYVGGLSLLFEWNSKEAEIQSLEFNFGLPMLARNLGAIKSVLHPFGKVLEVDRLDFNSKALSPVKSLVLTDRMDDLNQTLSVLLNGRIYLIRIFEEQFHTNILFPSSSLSSKFDDSDSAFEEEYVGPSMTAHGEVDGEGDRESKDDNSSFRASERSPLAQHPKFMSRVAGSSSPKADPIYDNLNSLSSCVLSVPMKGISLNCNGLRFDNKRAWVKDLIGSEDPDFFGIQESNMGFMGASDGIITMWDTRLFSYVSVIDSRNFLGVIRSWFGISHKIGLLNVYAPQSFVLKVQLWSAVENLIRSNDVVWIVFGDFNVVRCQNERFGSSFDINEASAFNDFISRVGVTPPNWVAMEYEFGSGTS
ncbi:nucleotide-binding alpha-beta plait domain-containing protein [Tanacetum coccineum]